MDIEMLEFRSIAMQAVRSFLSSNGFLEVDTPSLSSTLIPESCLEVFKTEYIKPYQNKSVPLFLTPSPELYIKELIAKHKRSFFQLSKCYRNVESIGHLHSPEFTMLEYYAMEKDYKFSIELTKNLLLYMANKLKDSPLLSLENISILNKGFLIKTVEELFVEYAHFSLKKEHSKKALFAHAKALQPTLELDFDSLNESSLYDMIFVHAIEANLPKDRLVLVIDYPQFSSCLAKEKTLEDELSWALKERWELYGNGIEMCNCYTEERDSKKIDSYFENEEKIKNESAIVKHPSISNFGAICERMPLCSGVAMGFDRLLMFLSGRKDISSVLPFPLMIKS
ncbi:MAG: amino acid--tRNA ligase-related protein [Treponema sp.]